MFISRRDVYSHEYPQLVYKNYVAYKASNEKDCYFRFGVLLHLLLCDICGTEYGKSIRYYTICEINILISVLSKWVTQHR